METTIYNSTIEAIQDGNLDISSKAEGDLISDNMFFHQNISKNKNEEMDSKLNQKVNFTVSDHVSENPKEKPCNGNTTNTLGAESEKTLSPTLIEHAFNVVKNLFSPEKIEVCKPNSVINQQRSSSGSPCNSLYIPNKPDFYNLQEPDIDPPVTWSTPTDENFKGEKFCTNQVGVLPISFNIETVNKTDDSFTTVSPINESFQSAVTHLDENGEFLKNDNLEHENIFNDSRNLNVLDVSSTSNSGEMGLDNTMLKNSLGHTENKPQNILNHSNNNVCNFDDAVTPNIGGNESTNEKYLCISQKSCNDTPTSGSEKNSEKIIQQLLEPKDISEYDFLPESEIVASGKIILSNEIDNNFNLVAPSGPKEIKILKSASASNNYLKNGGNTEKQNIVDSEIIKKDNEKDSEKKITDIKTFSLKHSIKQVEILDKKDELTDAINRNDFSTEEKKAPRPTEAKAEDYSHHLKFTESNSDICLNEKDVEVENSISSTTIVISESDSILDFHDSLKENCLEPEVTVKKESNFTPVTISSCSNDFTSPKSKKILSQIDNNKQHKRLTKSEVKNYPNKISSPNRNKLNKSADSVTKNLSKNSRRRKEELPIEKFDITNEKLSCLPGKIPNHTNTEENSENENNSSKCENNVPNIVSQQSYTVLNTVDKNLQRPVIHSSEDLSSDFFKCKSEEWNPILSKQNDSEKISVSNEHSGISAENLSRVNTTITSSPVCKSTPNKSKILDSKASDRTANEKELYSNVASESPNLSYKNGELDEMHPILSEELLSYSPENEKSPSNSFEVNDPCIKVAQALNNTYDKKSESVNHQLNQTYNKIQVGQEFGSCKPEGTLVSPEIESLNQTYEIKTESPESVINQTYDKNPNKLNKTYNKKCEILNRTFDVPEEPTNNFNQTFDVPEKPANNLNETFEKITPNPENLNQSCLKNVDKFNGIIPTDEKAQTEVAPSNKISSEDVIEAKACPTTIIEKPTLKSELPVIFSEGMGDNEEALNASFSTNGSVASLFLNNNATMVLNQGNVVDDLSRASKETFQSINLKQDAEESSNNPGKSTSPEDFQIQNHSIFVNKQLPTSPKYDKVHCDLELVQLIQEQFSSTDIEKICSVVDDMSIKKLSNQIQKASEQFVKSIHDVIPNGDLTEAKNDSFPEKFVGALTPQGFEFLSSIQGNPTGRDLSRESLYVKFDPLFQTLNSNSLIDFTKEAEPVFSALECVPKTIAADETDSCKNILTVSPEKKSDDLVPPLTPLSQRGKNNLKEDEKLKYLQNENYFLKNLYAERERNNRAKMEEYENQITKLTGQICVLEGIVKDSNEREKSLAKKVEVQNQNLENLKLVLDEYCNAIIKLSGELEELRKEEKACKEFEKMQEKALALEKDSYVTHLENIEAAFCDVHTKYEKSKKIIANMKGNEATLRSKIAELMQKLEEHKKEAKLLQEEACKEFEKMQEELATTKANHDQEAARLRARLRKTELKVEALQESLDQKIKENQQLTAICDEFIEGKK